jgi:hypothetical protein
MIDAQVFALKYGQKKTSGSAEKGGAKMCTCCTTLGKHHFKGTLDKGQYRWLMDSNKRYELA